MTPSGIEPATFRFVAQHLNHCGTAVPCDTTGISYNEYWWLLGGFGGGGGGALTDLVG